MHKRDQTASSYIPAHPPSLRHDLAQRTYERTGAPHVIISEAQAVGVRHTLTGWLMLAGPVTVIIVAVMVVYKLDGWPLACALALLAVWSIAAGFVAHMASMGQMLAWLTDIRWGRLAMLQERNRHEEEMLRMDLQAQDGRTEAQLTQIRVDMDALSRRLLVDASGHVVDVAPSYVPNHVDPIRTKALTWAATLYKGGRPDPDHVRLDGRIYDMTLPFSARGEWDSAESAEGRRYLMERGIILEVPGGYALNIAKYPTLPALGRV